jgi:D-beta-D-heptose 7-phosphate kinase/D-beta-D-heptose 1-phosphate adenosyltransferase
VSPRAPASKILSRTELLERFARPRTSTLVFTNGCFDLLHPGHVAYLAAARELGDALVVALNTDASVRRLAKSPDRPLVPEADRCRVVAALEAVDAVCVFGEDTPRELIEQLVPDVLVKGGDYTLEGVVGREAVERAGGRVELIPFLGGYSTTALVQRIRGGVS